MCQVLEKIAQEVSAKSIAAVAIAYVLHKAPFVFPIVCGRKVEQFMSNIEDLSIRLTEEHVEEIEDVKPFAKDYL